MNINDAVEHVRQFHEHIGAPVGDQARLLAYDEPLASRVASDLALLHQKILAQSGAGDLLMQRVGMLLEETEELIAAHLQRDLIAAADAVTDVLYVALGTAVCAGLPIADLFKEVHESNMTKEGDRGQLGKGLKGERYQPPDIRRWLRNHI